MKKLFILCSLLGWVTCMLAQDNDPIVMRVNGKNVTRSEFEYNYNKNNNDNVVEKKTIEEYVDLFVNYKLKVEAALDACYDTLSSFKKEFATYRNQQILPYFVSSSAEEREIRNYYDRMKESIGPDGLVFPAHIMVIVPQNASNEVLEGAKQRIDSIYQVLREGAEFATVATQCSDDKSSAVRGGMLGWISKGQTIKEFEDKAFELQKGEMSAPVLSPMGYHIILMTDRKQLESYEELRPQIESFLSQRGLKERLASFAVDSIGKASQLTAEEVIEKKCEELCANDAELKYLIQEYHDGLLLYEISSREVWDKAANDVVALQKYFKANKSKYKWDEPRYKGLVCHAKDETLQKQVKKLLKSVDESEWIDTLRATFNRDSLKQIRVEKNLFKKGDNKYVDNIVFKVKEKPKAMKTYPVVAVYGKKLKSPDVWTDVQGEVISDYQTFCEEQFVQKLRERYSVEIFKEVINTVNKH